jgi:hypothetical protein
LLTVAKGMVLSNDKKQVLFSFGGWLDAGQGCSTACPSNAGHFCYLYI